MRLLASAILFALIAAAFSGCFHGKDKADAGDGGDGGDTTPPPSGDDDNNTTTPPEPEGVAPVASISMLDGSGMEINVTYVNGRGSPHTEVTLDGSNSTDEDGSIVVYAWLVTGPGNFDFRDQNQTTSLVLDNESGYGTYTVRLTVIDDENFVGTANATLYVGYDITRAGLLSSPAGPAVGQGSRDGANEISGTSWAEHRFSVIENATGATVTISWTASATSEQAAVYVLFGGAVVNSAQSGGSPRTLVLTASQLESVGQYAVEVHLNGVSDANGFEYTFRAVVDYHPSA